MWRTVIVAFGSKRGAMMKDAIRAILLVGLLVAGVVAYVMVFRALRDPDAGVVPQTRTAAAPSAAGAQRPASPAVLHLPDKQVDVKEILGKKRAQVRALLGKPTSSLTRPQVSDVYEGGKVNVWVTYANGVANEVGAGFAEAITDGNKAQALGWLGIALAAAQAETFTVLGSTYRIRTSGNQAIVTEAGFLAKQESKARADQQRAERVRIASNLQRGFYQQGVDAEVTVSGREGTTLWIVWVLCSRATLYQFMEGEGGYRNDMEAAARRETLRKAGFKAVKCYDPLSEAGVGQQL